MINGCTMGFGFMALLVAVSLAAATVTAQPAPMTNERLGLPPATEVWTVYGVVSADFCGPCKKLRAKLADAGATFKTETTTSEPVVNAYPTVFYVNNAGYIEKDNGEKINAGLFRLPKEPVVIIEYVTRGR